MDIRVQSVKFDADVKLLDFIDKKVGKLEKFYEEIINAEVTLTLLPDTANKCVKEDPFPDSYIELTDFPKLFNRNMSGNEEYRAGFSMFFKMSPGEIPLEEVT